MSNQMVHKRIKSNELFLLLLFTLYVFQNLLDDYIPFFSNIDELPVVFAMFYFLFHRKSAFDLKKGQRLKALAYAGFFFAGILGNVLYHYQKTNLVVIDIITNFKFFLTIYFFANHFAKIDFTEYKTVPRYVEILSYFLFAYFLLDRVLVIYPSNVRYGIRSARLFFGHPTYLAGCCVFLISVMMLYHRKNCKLPIAMNLVMLAFTVRGKALAGVAIFLMLYFIVIIMHSKLKIWQIVVVAIAALAIAWSQFYFYYVKLSGASARSVILGTSIRIMHDYFPIGTGFGTFASHSAIENYSPVYLKYGFNRIYEVRNSTEGTFFDDQFWPIIFGQTGVIGTVCYLILQFLLYKRIQGLRRINSYYYVSAMFLFLYLIVSSIAEPAYNNSIAVPMATVLGLIFARVERVNTPRKIDHSLK